MLLKPLGIRIVIIGVALVAGIVAGTFGLGSAIASTNSNRILTPAASPNAKPILRPAPVYKTNENGQTYGTDQNATSLATEPDLISALGVDGTLGYVRSVDLIEEMPKTPQEALAEQNKRKPGDVRQIPLYAVDGKTVIGIFNIVTPQVIEKSAEK